MLFRPGFKALRNGVSHALYAQNAYDAYNYLSSKKKMYIPITPKSIQKRLKLARQRAPKPADNVRALAITKASSRHSGKPTNHKKHKKVKVTKVFKDKVTKALAGKTISGSWDQISYDILNVSTFPNNQQFVGGLGELQSNDYSDWAFDPEDVLHAASVLWNNKADSQGSRIWNNSQNISYSETGFLPNIQTDTRLFANSRFQLNTKITIKRSYEIYKLKNNTQRTIIMKIFLCAPKVEGFKQRDIAAQPGGGDAPVGSISESHIGNPGQMWINELQKQVFSNINVADTKVQTLYNTPKDCPGFNKVYKTDITTVVLEPGQIFDYYINGPSNFTIDYNTLFRGAGAVPEISYYHGIQKWMRYPLFTAYLDLVTDGAMTGHFAPSAAAGNRLGVCIERQMKYNLEMPESVGSHQAFNTGTNANLVGIVENNMRRDCYFRKVYPMSGVLADTQSVNVQQPATLIDQQ